MFESGQAFHFFIAILFGPEWHGNQKSAEETPHNSTLFFAAKKHKKFSQFNHLRFPKLFVEGWFTKSPPFFPQKNIGCPVQDAVGGWPFGFDRFRFGGADDQHPPGREMARVFRMGIYPPVN